MVCLTDRVLCDVCRYEEWERYDCVKGKEIFNDCHCEHSLVNTDEPHYSWDYDFPCFCCKICRDTLTERTSRRKHKLHCRTLRESDMCVLRNRDGDTCDLCKSYVLHTFTRKTKDKGDVMVIDVSIKALHTKVLVICDKEIPIKTWLC
jgi:hypothetical protein